MLGELYQPKGLALETARAVLEVDDPWSVNVAWGCRNCTYCYNRRRTGGNITYPKEPPVELVRKQLAGGLKPEGVFLSFGCEPLLDDVNFANTWNIVNLLREHDIPVAVLSKMDTLLIAYEKVRHGMTIVSLSHIFDFQYEPGALSSVQRVEKLQNASARGCYTWVSIEPYMPPAMVKQDLRELLEKISFVDFILMGKLNYDTRANTPEVREYYQGAITILRDFCNDHGIRYYIKKETILFAEKWKK